jgi:hypothetical protein
VSEPVKEEREEDFDVETSVMQLDEDEVGTPVDIVNRGTFDYCRTEPFINHQMSELRGGIF